MAETTNVVATYDIRVAFPDAPADLTRFEAIVRGDIGGSKIGHVINIDFAANLERVAAIMRSKNLPATLAQTIINMATKERAKLVPAEPLEGRKIVVQPIGETYDRGGRAQLTAEDMALLADSTAS